MTLALAIGCLTAASASAQQLPCRPCAGLRVENPESVLSLLAGSGLDGESPLYISWEVSLDPVTATTTGATTGYTADDEGLAARLDRAGAVPWPLARFSTPSPVLQNLPALDEELKVLTRIAARVGERGYVQIDWRPTRLADGSTPMGDDRARSAEDFAFLIKRAAVAITGANRKAQVVVGPIEPDVSLLRALYDEEIAAYVDGVALAPGDDAALAEAIEVLGQLDPGRPVILDGPTLPEPPELALAEAARASAAGFAVSIFHPADGRMITPEGLAPLTLLAREFGGDLSLDPYSEPRGGLAAWSFVRGEDLSLQVIVEVEPGVDEVTLAFDEGQLKQPRRIMLDGESIPLLAGRGPEGGLRLDVADPGRVLLLELNRLTAAEIEGIAGLDEAVTVESERTIPVAEILRRHQAFQDALARRLLTYSAENTLSLRLQATTGSQGFDITFQGDYFFTQGEGFDWAWQRFFVNGVSWRNQRVPQIPLLQPEKASAAPAEITLTKEYSYRLRGSETVADRDCWVVDFEPAVEVTEDKSLYQGTVWIDKETYARVKSRTLQLGLRGDVVSNDETIFFEPLDDEGQPTEWSSESFVLPTRTKGQQVFSILNAALVVERELTLDAIRINPEDFESRRAEVLASDATMLRDTEEGMRYLVTDKETGERVVQVEPDPTRLFLLGGVFYDEALDYPLPLAGVNWLSFDFKGKGGQANVFFGGLLVIADLATPSLFGSRWEAGIDAFVLGVPGTDTLYVDGMEADEQDVERMRPNIDVTLGRSLGNFFKAQFEYSLGWSRFGRADDTAPDFVIPSDHLDHTFLGRLQYNRRGYRLRLDGAYTLRDEWEPWGLPGNPDYDPDKDHYTTWGAGIAKTWFLPKFLQTGVELEYVGGDNLDRFSKYEFGPFSDIVVRGYRSDLIRAEEAVAAHAFYGFNMGELFQLRLVGDTAWVTDEATGLDNELLAGVGLSGTVVGPWRTIVNIEVGKAVAGPDDGFTAFIAFLKLFN